MQDHLNTILQRFGDDDRHLLLRLGDPETGIEGDWTKIVGPDVTYAEITIVHEMGHLLEAKAHGAEGIVWRPGSCWRPYQVWLRSR